MPLISDDTLDAKKLWAACFHKNDLLSEGDMFALHQLYELLEQAKTVNNLATRMADIIRRDSQRGYKADVDAVLEEYDMFRNPGLLPVTSATVTYEGYKKEWQG